MTPEPAEPAQPDLREEPDLAKASQPQGDSGTDNDTDADTDVMGIDDDDPIDATLVGEPVKVQDDESEGKPGSP